MEKATGKSFARNHPEKTAEDDEGLGRQAKQIRRPAPVGRGSARTPPIRLPRRTRRYAPTPTRRYELPTGASRVALACDVTPLAS
jgi:hypothetical protein